MIQSIEKGQYISYWKEIKCDTQHYKKGWPFRYPAMHCLLARLGHCAPNNDHWPLMTKGQWLKFTISLFPGQGGAGPGWRRDQGLQADRAGAGEPRPHRGQGERPEENWLHQVTGGFYFDPTQLPLTRDRSNVRKAFGFTPILNFNFQISLV